MAGVPTIVNRLRAITKVPQAPPVQCAFVLRDAPNIRVPWESFPEEGISEVYNASYKATPGWSEPFAYIYEKGDYGTIDIDILFHAGHARYPLGGAAPEQLEGLLFSMEQKVRLLQSFSFPKPDQRRSQATSLEKLGFPSDVLMVIGDFMVVPGLVMSTTINWMHPFHPVSVRPYTASVQVSFQPVDGGYPDFYDVSGFQPGGTQGASFRGTVPGERGTPPATTTVGAKQEERARERQAIALRIQLAEARTNAIQNPTDPNAKQRITEAESALGKFQDGLGSSIPSVQGN